MVAPTTLGIAISGTEVRAANGWRASLDAPPIEGIAWPSLADALSSLASTAARKSSPKGDAPPATLAIALLPPLTEVRRLDLPPLNDIELQRLLARNAGRYFVNARGAQVVGFAAAGKRTRGAPMPVVATAAAARLVAMVRTAAQQAGWTVASIAPAESAWAAGVIATKAQLAKQNGWAVIKQPDRTTLLELGGGRLVGVRRFRGEALDASLIAETVGKSTAVEVASDADLLAARFAGREIGPSLRGEESVVVEQARARKAAWLVVAAGAVLLALAAGAELWGVRHQLALVRAERARIKPQLATTLVGRSTVDATTRHLQMLNAVDRDATHWTQVITTLSQAITDDAYLTAFRARNDSLVIDGYAEHASRVFDALQAAKVATDVKSAAPVRRELQDDGSALDRFTISARIAPAAPATKPASTPAAASPSQP